MDNSDEERLRKIAEMEAQGTEYVKQQLQAKQSELNLLNDELDRVLTLKEIRTKAHQIRMAELTLRKLQIQELRAKKERLHFEQSQQKEQIAALRQELAGVTAESAKKRLHREQDRQLMRDIRTRLAEEEERNNQLAAEVHVKLNKITALLRRRSAGTACNPIQ